MYVKHLAQYLACKCSLKVTYYYHKLGYDLCLHLYYEKVGLKSRCVMATHFKCITTAERLKVETASAS